MGVMTQGKASLDTRAAAPGRFSDRYLMTVVILQQAAGAMCFPISKYGLDIIEPFTFAFYRFVISSVILAAIVLLKKHDIPIARSDYWKIIGLGFLIIPFNQTLYLLGQSLTGAGHGAMLFATVPVWILLAALLHLKEKFAWRRGLGVAVALVGVFVIMKAGASEFGKEYFYGDLIILVAVIAWAYYTVLGKPLVRKYGALRVTAYALLSGSVLYFPFGLYMALKFDYSQVTLGAWGSVLYMAVGISVVVYVVWYWLLKYWEASRIAVYHNIQPVLAAAVAFVWLGEPVGWSFVVGSLIALSGIVLAEV